MRVTASRVGLLTHCAWSFRPEAQWTDGVSFAANKGTRFHAAIAHYITAGEFALAGDDEDIVPLCEVAQKWVDNYGRMMLAAEVAFAYDVASDTAESLGQNIGRDYSAGKGRLCGSADIVAVDRATRTGYVGDWSTGDGTRKGPQLRTLALMLARTEDLDSVTVEALEVSPAGVRSVCREELDAFALAAVAGDIADGIAGIDWSVPVPGEWCGKLYCGARATCPAGDDAVAQLVPAEALTRKLSVSIASPDHAAHMLSTIRLVEAKCDEIKSLIRAYVPKDGLLLEDGSLLVEGVRNVNRVNHAKVEMLARTLGATDEQIESCSAVVQESAGLKVRKPAKARKARKAS